MGVMSEFHFSSTLSRPLKVKLALEQPKGGVEV